MDAQNPEGLLLARISELIATPRKPPQNKDDLGKFLIFCVTAWEAVNNLLKSLKLSRTLLPKGLFPKGDIAYVIVATLNQIIEEITSMFKYVYLFFKRNFAHLFVSKSPNKMKF
jgi:hypothetical protein